MKVQPFHLAIPVQDLKIDLTASRIYSENYAENYIVENDLYR